MSVLSPSLPPLFLLFPTHSFGIQFPSLLPPFLPLPPVSSFVESTHHFCIQMKRFYFVRPRMTHGCKNRPVARDNAETRCAGDGRALTSWTTRGESARRRRCTRAATAGVSQVLQDGEGRSQECPCAKGGYIMKQRAQAAGQPLVSNR